MARKAFQLVKGVHVPGTKWLLVREIARGGMGVTWEVVKHPGIRGVMKMILPDLSTSASYVRRFLEEVEILTKLNHPNIVQVFDFDQLDDGTPFFVMERLEGKSLGAAMITTKGGARVRKAFPARVAYEITRQTCEALYRAHSLQPKGVIHRDLKPENVYIHHPPFGGEPVIKLLDFGVAAFEQATRESGPVGTPRYMAPEQLRCEDITPKADLYAMGLVLYEMLVGRGPFDHLTSTVHPNDRALILVNAHLNETPPPPSQFAPWIPQTIDSLLLSALDKDPEKRPVSAYAFVAKLYELQFVNDGTPREAIDANTTAPTLVKIIEDDAPESDPVVSPPARSSLPNDTVRDAPRDFSGHTVEMPIDPFGNTTPKVQPVNANAQDGVDRNAPTRLSADLPPRRRVASYDTEPMLSRELERPRERTAPSPAPTNPEATPLTSEMPARSEERRATGRPSKHVPPRAERGGRARMSGARVLGLFLILCPVGAGLGLALKHFRAPAMAGTTSSPQPALVTLPSASEASAVRSATAPAASPPPVASTPPATAAETQAPPLLAPTAPSATATSVAAVTATPALVPASSASARPKLQPARPSSAKPGPPKPSGAVKPDDGRDLLYVPPERQP